MEKSGGWIAAAMCLVAAFGVSGDGISGTGSAFKSIVIDGVHYETANALVRSNGMETTLDTLKVGHRVYALVDPDTLTALEIDQYDAVVGKIEGVAVIDETLNAYEFQVLNQTVRTTINTVSHEKDFEIKKGNHVAIGGVRDAAGVIWATSIEDADKIDKKEGPILTGIVGEVGDHHFEIAGLRVEAPYHAEYVQEGWLVPGAAVLVLGGKDRDDTLEAETVKPVPIELTTLEDSSTAAAQSWTEGPIEWVDAGARELQINGLRIELDRSMPVLDKRDEIRNFDIEFLQATDLVEIAVREDEGRLKAVKLIRKKKTKTRLRAPLQSWDDVTGAVTLLNMTVSDIDQAEIKYRGKKIKLEDLRESLSTEDGLLLEWSNKGELKKLLVVSDSDRWANHRKKEK